jgi:hypothetical protein
MSEKPTKMRIVESLIGTLSGELMAMHSALKAAVQDSGCVRDEAPRWELGIGDAERAGVVGAGRHA